MNVMSMKDIAVGTQAYRTLEQGFETDKFRESMEDTTSASGEKIVVKSGSGKQNLTLASQKDKLTEFMKVFSLAH